MIKSKIFEKDAKQNIELSVIDALNNIRLMSNATINSPRAVGDAVQEYLENNFVNFLPRNLIKDFSATFARRAMADFAFTDIDNNYYVIDSKTHRLDSAFNMPNLTSVERLARLYEDDSNYFVILLVSYKVSGGTLIFNNCIFTPIETLDWSCLTIGALGWGQIQLANANKVVINESNTRKKWMLQLCDTLDLFYPNEISKIAARVEYFKRVREYWNNKE